MEIAHRSSAPLARRGRVIYESYLLMLSLFFASLPRDASYQAQKSEVESDIRAAVLSYMFEHEAQQQKPHTKVLYISIDKKDPDDKFMARFKGHTPPVKKGSESVISGDIGGVMDKKSNDQPGIVFQVGSRYLVFAQHHRYADSRASVHPCSGTKLVTDAQEEIAYFESVHDLNLAADVLG